VKKACIVLFMTLICNTFGYGQSVKTQENKIIFSGIVRDAATLSPLPNSQISINRSFVAVSDEEGTFSIVVNRRDSVVFSILGYRPAYFYVSDTLTGRNFMAGVYMKTDTLSIGEVIVVPRMQSLKYDIFKAPATTPEMENAKYNMAISAYQGRMGITQLGDPASNYSIVQQKRLRDASEKGTIPSDRMVGLSPFMLVGAVYLLINGLPEKPAPMKSSLTRQELDQIHKKYLESAGTKK
jgi:hypothetical protein